MIYLRLAPYVIALLIMSYGYYTWQNMKSTIETKTQIIEDKTLEIKTLNANIETNKIIYLKEKQKAVFDAISKTKKQTLEDKINYDKNNSVDTNSTNFYL